jgi:hypothetical protein
MKKSKEDKEINVLQISHGRVDFCLVGATPIIFNRTSEKAQRQLLLPKQRGKTTEATLRHDPLAEYQASPYKSRDPNDATLIRMPSTAFKSALRNAALDSEGSSKAQIGRLTFVPGEWINIYGLPQLRMDMVRNSGINRTPDVRTRACIRHWAARVSIAFVQPVLTAQAVANLFAAAGLMIGIGDYRNEKGAGNYGSFKLVDADDPEFLNTIATGGRDVQQEAMVNPTIWDEESEELFSWFESEISRRGRDKQLADSGAVTQSKANGKSKRTVEA